MNRSASTLLLVLLVPPALLACGSSPNSSGSGGGGGGAGTSSTSSSSGNGGASSSSSTSSSTSSTSTSTSSSSSGAGAGGGGACDIGVWTDVPGACPPGMPKVDITDMTQLASATRGDDAYANDAPATCYFIHNGDYMTTGSVFYVLHGGDPGGARRVFVGESRAGVVIHGRGTVEDDVSDVTISNMTFDLTGYSQSGSFNTLGVGSSPSGKGKNITIDHVTFTGDCATGANGGHIEINSGDNVLVDSCIIEKYGRCGPNGHQDHGVYLANGTNIVFRNNLIRGNASRGIQMYTAGGDYGSLKGVTIECNRIYQNGHADYEDGFVINSYGTGDITDVTIQHNVIDHNFYSGIRFAGGLEKSIVVRKNTFDGNGAGSTAAGRSEINIDDAGGGSGTTIDTNIFAVGNTLINNCYDGTSLGFSIGVNFVHGAVPSGAQGNCVGAETMGDPMFANASGGDYHPQNTAAASFGAYAP